MNSTQGGEISVSPPETLVKFDAPLFAGIEPNEKSAHKNNHQETGSKIEDMLNSMIPPRYY